MSDIERAAEILRNSIIAEKMDAYVIRMPKGKAVLLQLSDEKEQYSFLFDKDSANRLQAMLRQMVSSIELDIQKN